MGKKIDKFSGTFQETERKEEEESGGSSVIRSPAEAVME